MKRKILLITIASVIAVSMAVTVSADEDYYSSQDYQDFSLYIEESPDYYSYDELYAGFQSDRSLYYGLNGDDVVSLQNRLSELGYYSAAIDGDFGSYTQAAVLAFQSACGIYADGIVGSETASYLNQTSASASQTVSVSSSDLLNGSSGDEVLDLQNRLAELGYYTEAVDGVFGSYTESAVIAFQNANGLFADGVVGPITKGILYAASSNASITPALTDVTLSIGSTGNDVVALQEKLISLGYLDSSADGIFGSYTYQAVIAFQSDNGLTADGVVGPVTLEVLNGTSDDDDDETDQSSLSSGMIGTDVYNLQTVLIDLGYLDSEATGYYGELTGAAVADFQKDYDITPTGTADSATLAKLNSISSGSIVIQSDITAPVSVSDGSVQAIIDAAYSTPSTSAGYCSQWIGNVLSNAGINFSPYSYRDSELSYAAEYGLADEWYQGDTSFNANDYWAYVCDISDISQIQPGMIIAVRNSFSYLGQQFGHVGIYVGDDTVLSSVGYIEELSLSDWIATYNNTELGSTVRCGYIY